MNFDYIEALVKQGVAYAPKVVMALVALIVGLIIIRQLMNIIANAMEKRGVDDTLRPFLLSLIGIMFKVLLFVAIAGMVGVETTSFAAVIGAMAFAVGMALQGSLGNFAGGVLLLIFKPIKVGDLINAMGYTGVVEEIKAFSTKLVTPDNRSIILPNGPLSTAPIENISTKGVIRVDMTFGIGYGDDIDKAKEVIHSVIKACPNTLTDREHDVFVTELAGSSVNFAVRPWAKSEHYWDVYFYFQEEIKKAFDREGVGIPYETFDVNLVKAN